MRLRQSVYALAAAAAVTLSLSGCAWNRQAAPTPSPTISVSESVTPRPSQSVVDPDAALNELRDAAARAVRDMFDFGFFEMGKIDDAHYVMVMSPDTTVEHPGARWDQEARTYDLISEPTLFYPIALVDTLEQKHVTVVKTNSFTYEVTSPDGTILTYRVINGQLCGMLGRGPAGEQISAFFQYRWDSYAQSVLDAAVRANTVSPTATPSETPAGN